MYPAAFGGPRRHSIGTTPCPPEYTGHYGPGQVPNKRRPSALNPRPYTNAATTPHALYPRGGAHTCQRDIGERRSCRDARSAAHVGQGTARGDVSVRKMRRLGARRCAMACEAWCEAKRAKRRGRRLALGGRGGARATGARRSERRDGSAHAQAVGEGIAAHRSGASQDRSEARRAAVRTPGRET